MGKSFDMVYENPAGLLDEPAWLAWRNQMLAEAKLHPEWHEPRDAYEMAVDHLEWIKRETGNPHQLAF